MPLLFEPSGPEAGYSGPPRFDLPEQLDAGVAARRRWALPASALCHLVIGLLAAVGWTADEAPPVDAPVSPTLEITYLTAMPTAQVQGSTPEPVPRPDETRLDFEGFSVDLTRLTGEPDLFPFLTTPLPIADFAPGDTVESLAWTSGAGAAPPRREPLAVTDAELQALIDQMWSRRERWEAFMTVAPLFEQHHPDQGRLPDLLRGHLDQNLLQPFNSSFRYMRQIPDPRTWAQLELAVQHADFIGLAGDYINAHPGTRTSIEYLFLLEELAAGNLTGRLPTLPPAPDFRLLRS